MKHQPLGGFVRLVLVCVFVLVAGGLIGIQQAGAHSSSELSLQAATPSPVSTTTPSSVSTGLVTMMVSSDLQETPLDQLFTVNIRLSGDSSQCGQSVVIKPVDVYQVIDHSGSMDDNDKLEQAQLAASSFLDEMDFSVDRVGIVQFDDSAQVLQSLTNDSGEIDNAINSITVAGGTNVADGLTVAYEALKPDRRVDAVPVIIVLSDGQSDVNSITHASATAKADGVVVVAVGLGADVDENAMKSMASLNIDGNPLYYYAPDPSQLKDVYASIAKAIRRYGLAKNILVRFQVDIYKFQIVPDSISQGGALAGDTITWQQDILDNGDTSFTFQVRGRDAGEYAVGQVTEAKFMECEQDEKGLKIEDSPSIKITQISDPPPVPLVCSWWQTFPWWILAPLLLFFILAIFALTPPGRALVRKLLAKPILCKLLSSLFVLLLLMLSALIARALIGDICRGNDLYFWKITQAGDVGIYQTKFDGDTAVPVKALNQGSNCVACHEVSNNKLVAGVRNEQNGEVAVIQHNGNGIPIPPMTASYVSWSPDGNRLALSYNDADIYILDIVSGDLLPLSGASDPNIVETMPAWSPDGNTIAFVRTRQTAPPPDTAEIDEPCDIYTIPASGGQSLPLPGASGDGFNYYPSYSPDGKWLAFTHHLDGHDTYADDAADIYIIPAMGTQKPIRLSINSEQADSWPTWSPDSKWLGFSSNRRDGQFDIFVSPIGINGLPYELQYDEQGNRSAVFKIESAAMPQDEEFHPVWVYEGETSVLERLLDLLPWLILLLLLAVLLWLFCRQRKYTINVEVVDGLTGQPLDNSTVQFVQSNRGGLDE